MLTIQDYIPITKAKSRLLDIVRKIEDSDGAIAITKNGVPEAVLLSMDKFEGLVFRKIGSRRARRRHRRFF